MKRKTEIDMTFEYPDNMKWWRKTAMELLGVSTASIIVAAAGLWGFIVFLNWLYKS